MPQTASRRTLLTAGAWSVPVIALATSSPTFAASPNTAIDYGLYVSSTYNGGQLGYTPSQDVTGKPTTPEAYFASSNVESDLNWNDATNKATNSRLFTNGEGSFTPVTNGPNGTAGGYGALSGFWFSSPTTAENTGTGYIVGASTTLAAGATFYTDVEYVFPKMAAEERTWVLNNIRLPITGTNGAWNAQRTGPIGNQPSTSTYLNLGTPKGTWTALKPVITDNSDGGFTFRGQIRSVTGEPATAKATTTGKQYAQVLFMPASVTHNSSYGWTSFQLTSYVQSASFTYSGLPGGTPPPPLTALAPGSLRTTSRIVPFS